MLSSFEKEELLCHFFFLAKKTHRRPKLHLFRERADKIHRDSVRPEV